MSAARHQAPGIRAHLQKYGLAKGDRRRLDAALAALTDLHGPIEKAMRDAGPRSIRDDEVTLVCDGLRLLVDGPDGEFF